MDIDNAKAMLENGDGPDQPVFLPPAILDKLTVDDLGPDTFVGVGILKDGIMDLDWSGRLSMLKTIRSSARRITLGRGSTGTSR